MNKDNINIKLSKIEDISEDNSDNIEYLRELYRDFNPEIRMRVVEKIGHLDLKSMRPEVIRAIRDKDSLVRSAALEVVGDWHLLSEFDSVLATLEDEDSLVRCAAFDAIGKLGKSEAAPILLAMMDHISDRERVSCVTAIARLQPQHSAERARELLEIIKSKDYRARCAVANSIVEIWPTNNHPELVKYLNEALARETVKAVISSIKETLCEISN